MYVSRRICCQCVVEQGRLAVNGMSYHDRAGENANSAVIVTVTKDDYGSDHPLAGMEFQRRLEKKAWEEAAAMFRYNDLPISAQGQYQ